MNEGNFAGRSLGDRRRTAVRQASRWAVTRVNPEQASKVRDVDADSALTGGRPPRSGEAPTDAATAATGVVGTARQDGFLMQRGKPACDERSRRSTPLRGGGRRGCRGGSQYQGSGVMAVEGRGLTSGCFLQSQGCGDWREPGDSREHSAAAAEAVREGEAGAGVPVRSPVRQGVPRRHSGPRLLALARGAGGGRRRRGTFRGHRRRQESSRGSRRWERSCASERIGRRRCAG